MGIEGRDRGNLTRLFDRAKNRTKARTHALPTATVGLSCACLESGRIRLKISEDSAALVAAHLTNAWAKIDALNTGLAGLADDQKYARIKEAYGKFRGLIEAAHISPPTTGGSQKLRM